MTNMLRKNIINNNSNNRKISVAIELEVDDEYSSSLEILKASYLDKISDKDINYNQEMLSLYREQIKELNLNYLHNIDFIEDERVQNITFSSYTPYIFGEIEVSNIRKIADFNNVKMIGLSLSECEITNLSSIGQFLTYENNSQVESVNYDIDLAYNNITNVSTVITNYSDEVEDEDLDGSDVVIGIVEYGGVIDTTNPEFQRTIYNSWGSANTISDHATLVATIAAGGISGIASDATIFEYGISESTTSIGLIEPYIEQLVTYGANILNFSWGLGNSDGSYASFDAWIDYLVFNTYVSIVVAAGNEGDNEYLPYRYVMSPGNASNVITVGSTNVDGDYISTFSSISTEYNTQGEIQLIKPTLVAPGGDQHDVDDDGLWECESLGVPNAPKLNDTYEAVVAGTSFAAPQVTGAIALIMEYKPSFIFKPLEIMALLCSGTDAGIPDTTPDNPSGLRLESGAGLMNLERTFQTLELRNSFAYSNTNATPNSLVKSVRVYLHPGTIVIGHSYFRYQSSTSSYDIEDYDIVLTDNNGNTLKQSSSTISNLERVAYTIPNTGYYYIKVYVREKNRSNIEDVGFISVCTYNNDYIFGFPSSC